MKKLVVKLGVAIAGSVLVFACGNTSSGDSLSKEDYYRHTTEKTVAMATEEAINPRERLRGEDYKELQENTFVEAFSQPLSTFSIDVDKASYANVRRMLNDDIKPHTDAVRVEEMVNYFTYDYPFDPSSKSPVNAYSEIGECLWNDEHHLLKIGVKGRPVNKQERPKSNLVFLVDVSGSMSDHDKLPLFKKATKFLLNSLNDDDCISIVTYAGNVGVVLPSTEVEDKDEIYEALSNLESGGSTAGAAALTLAYEEALENFMEDGNNRIILITDGDFNVGINSEEELVKLIEEKRKSGIYLTVCGMGTGNFQDREMEAISNAGNGNYFYIDNLSEAQKIFERDLTANMLSVANDVKIQVEFNPAYVKSYRLVGYENRMLETQDFEDDKKDAGELGSGHSVTALYEIIPVGVKSKFLKDIDKLKYTKTTATNSYTDELLTVKFRYKNPDENKSKEIVYPLNENEISIVESTTDFKFASAVSLFGMKIKKSKYAKNANMDDVIALAEEGRGKDDEGYRAEFIRLVKSYK